MSQKSEELWLACIRIKASYPMKLSTLRRLAKELSKAGWSSREIASTLGIGLRTVQRYKK